MTDVTETTARLERERLAAALMAAGPDAPTLCEGWNTLDLAAHVVVREYRPDSVVGLVGPLRGYTEKVRREAAAEGLPALVAKLRSGPPSWSPFALPGVDAKANLLEYVVHHEDVRRGGGAGPRSAEASASDDATGTLDVADLQRLQDDVWAGLPGAAKLLTRKVSGALIARRTDTGAPVDLVLKTGEDPAVLVGAPVELVLYLFGRREAAHVSVEGSEAARTRLSGADLGA